MRKTRMKRNKRPANLLSMGLISVAVLLIWVVLFVKSSDLKERKETYVKREQYLLEKIEEQNARSEEIEEYRKYMQTKQYVEDMAKSKLGLVYPDEIIFEADE